METTKSATGLTDQSDRDLNPTAIDQNATAKQQAEYQTALTMQQYQEQQAQINNAAATSAAAAKNEKLQGIANIVQGVGQWWGSTDKDKPFFHRIGQGLANLIPGSGVIRSVLQSGKTIYTATKQAQALKKVYEEDPSLASQYIAGVVKKRAAPELHPFIDSAAEAILSKQKASESSGDYRVRLSQAAVKAVNSAARSKLSPELADLAAVHMDPLATAEDRSTALTRVADPLINEHIDPETRKVAAQALADFKQNNLGTTADNYASKLPEVAAANLDTVTDQVLNRALANPNIPDEAKEPAKSIIKNAVAGDTEFDTARLQQGVSDLQDTARDAATQRLGMGRGVSAAFQDGAQDRAMIHAANYVPGSAQSQAYAQGRFKQQLQEMGDHYKAAVDLARTGAAAPMTDPARLQAHTAQASVLNGHAQTLQAHPDLLPDQRAVLENMRQVNDHTAQAAGTANQQIKDNLPQDTISSTLRTAVKDNAIPVATSLYTAARPEAEQTPAERAGLTLLHNTSETKRQLNRYADIMSQDPATRIKAFTENDAGLQSVISNRFQEMQHQALSKVDPALDTPTFHEMRQIYQGQATGSGAGANKDAQIAALQALAEKSNKEGTLKDYTDAARVFGLQQRGMDLNAHLKELSRQNQQTLTTPEDENSLQTHTQILTDRAKTLQNMQSDLGRQGPAMTDVERRLYSNALTHGQTIQDAHANAIDDFRKAYAASEEADVPGPTPSLSHTVLTKTAGPLLEAHLTLGHELNNTTPSSIERALVAGASGDREAVTRTMGGQYVANSVEAGLTAKGVAPTDAKLIGGVMGRQVDPNRQMSNLEAQRAGQLVQEQVSKVAPETGKALGNAFAANVAHAQDATPAGTSSLQNSRYDLATAVMRDAASKAPKAAGMSEMIGATSALVAGDTESARTLAKAGLLKYIDSRKDVSPAAKTAVNVLSALHDLDHQPGQTLDTQQLPEMAKHALQQVSAGFASQFLPEHQADVAHAVGKVLGVANSPVGDLSQETPEQKQASLSMDQINEQLQADRESKRFRGPAGGGGALDKSATAPTEYELQDTSSGRKFNAPRPPPEKPLLATFPPPPDKSPFGLKVPMRDDEEDEEFWDEHLPREIPSSGGPVSEGGLPITEGLTSLRAKLFEKYKLPMFAPKQTPAEAAQKAVDGARAMNDMKNTANRAESQGPKGTGDPSSDQASVEAPGTGNGPPPDAVSLNGGGSSGRGQSLEGNVGGGYVASTEGEPKSVVPPSESAPTSSGSKIQGIGTGVSSAAQAFGEAGKLAESAAKSKPMAKKKSPQEQSSRKPAEEIPGAIPPPASPPDLDRRLDHDGGLAPGGEYEMQDMTRNATFEPAAEPEPRYTEPAPEPVQEPVEEAAPQPQPEAPQENFQPTAGNAPQTDFGPAREGQASSLVLGNEGGTAQISAFDQSAAAKAGAAQTSADNAYAANLAKLSSDNDPNDATKAGEDIDDISMGGLAAGEVGGALAGIGMLGGGIASIIGGCESPASESAPPPPPQLPPPPVYATAPQTNIALSGQQINPTADNLMSM